MTHGVKSKMASQPLARRLTRFAPFVSLLALAACSGVIGIEDLHQGPAPGGAGSSNGGSSNGGDNGTGGDIVGTGGANTMTGGSAGKGQGGGSAGSGVIGTGGALGEGGAGGDGPGGSTTVHGTVIDYWGHKIAQVPVQIGDTLVTTDAQGTFTIDNVPATYDVGLTVDFAGDYPRETYGWAFLGLTRRDPTLQVYSGIARRSGNIQLNPTNATATSTRTLSIALGGPDGADEFTGVDSATQTSTAWRGPATTQERAHGLFWQIDATSQLPTSYLGYDTALVALSDTTDLSMINLNLAATVPTSGNIAGTITQASGTNRENDVFVRFTSGATIKLVGDTTGPNTFSYLVPKGIVNSGVTLAAVEGDAYFGQYAVAHKDNLAAGTTGITATVPAPAKPLAPADGALNIDASSQFTILSGTGNPGAFVVSMIDEDYYQGLYVVTASKTFKVPVIPGGPYMFGSMHKYLWRVETHGALATVDAMTGLTAGFMDEFSGDNASPAGPHTGDGSFTISQANQFTAK